MLFLVSEKLVYTIIKDHKVYPLYLFTHQDVKETDFDQPLEHYSWLKKILNNNPGLHCTTAGTDLN